MVEDEGREQFIPIRKRELIELLCAGSQIPETEREPFRHFCQMLTSIYHFEYHTRLEDLKHAYAPFDPDADTKALIELGPDEKQARLDGLFTSFIDLLERANYTHLDMAEVKEAIEGGASDWGLSMEVDFGIFERIELFSRGDTVATRVRRRLQKFWRQEEIQLPVYKRLIMILKLQPHKRVPKGVDTNTVFVKVFKDIPKLDLEMLLPGARIMMPGFQRFKLGGSMLSSVGFVGYKIAHDIGDLAQAAIMKNPLAFWTPLSLIFGYSYKQYYGFQQTRVNYNLMLTQSLYFQNLDNNLGVLTRLVDEAEEQECREAVLGYYCLWRFAGEQGWTSEALDTYVELELEQRANLKVDFEIEDALAKLLRLGIVERVEDRYRALPLSRALELLDETWDNYFRYAKPTAGVPQPASA